MNEVESSGVCVEFQMCGPFFTLKSLYLSLLHMCGRKEFVILPGIRQEFVIWNRLCFSLSYNLY